MSPMIGLFMGTAGALRVPLGVRSSPCRSADVRMDFGDSFYQGFDKWAAEYPEEDRVNFPEYFVLPKGIYEVSLQKPLGIAFEEIEVGKGVKVRRRPRHLLTDTRVGDGGVGQAAPPFLCVRR
jgi:hypothetical protein